MSETGAINPSDRGMHLARVIDRAITDERASPRRRYPSDDRALPERLSNAAWLAENARDEDGNTVMERQAAQRLLTLPRKATKNAEIELPTIKAIADLLFDGDDSIVYIAQAVSRGMRPPKTGAWASAQPQYIDELPDSVQDNISDTIRQFGRAYGKI